MFKAALLLVIATLFGSAQAMQRPPAQRNWKKIATTGVVTLAFATATAA